MIVFIIGLALYLFFGAAMAAYLNHKTYYDEGFLGACAIFWPITIICILGYKLGRFLSGP